MRTAQTGLSGWGRFPCAVGTVARPERVHALHEAAAAPSALARGLGRSYGDASFNSRGLTILMERLDRLLAFEPESGWLACEAGVTLGEIIRVFAPRGYFPPVVPGTRHVTIGGAIACDIHGHNHHRDGSFGRHVRSFTILTGRGETLTCSRTENSDLFRATIGGMGLTGIIIDAEVRLQKHAPRRIIVDRERTRDLDGAVQLFSESDHEYAYSAAWIDSTARGKHIGRCVLLRGNDDHSTRPARAPAHSRIRLPQRTPGVLSGAAIRAFNALYYQTHRTRRGLRADAGKFLFPLDSVGEWSRLYGSRGFAQYQCLIPEPGVDALAAILERVSRSTHGAFLAVLKKFGAAEPDRILSFAGPGYSLAIDFPARPELLQLLHDIDQITASAGGRVYLARDGRVRFDVLSYMYPELPHWLAIKHKYDPQLRFESDLSRRLALT